MATSSRPAPLDGAPAQRFEFSTTDPDEAEDFIDTMYSARPPNTGRMDKTSPVSISQVSAGGLSYVDFTMPPDLTLHLAGTDDLSVTTLISGGTQAELGHHGRTTTERYRVGDVCLGSFPDGDYQVRCVNFRAGIVTVPAAALAATIGTLPGDTPPALLFESLRPVSDAAAAQWKHAATYARELLNNDLAASSPLIISSAARLLAATALTVFPNNVVSRRTHDFGRDRHDSNDAHPDTVRRAIAFINDNAHTDLTIADIAAAASVTSRAVQIAFRRHLDTTPMAYLRQVRLERAHHELLIADPATTTVTTIAARWGFYHPGRFATRYRATFGRAPTTTLHQ